MKVSLDVRLSLEENAAKYFEAAKKARMKIEGARKAIRVAEEKAVADVPVVVTEQAPKRIRKRSWYEKFKWFFASNGMLVIAGRDATTNELVIKRHCVPGDIVFHTGTPGSPFVVVQAEKTPVPEEVFQEAADFCAAHSKAWKLGLGDVEVYWVLPEQVTKEAKAGEYMSRGSFMVYGKRTFMHPRLKLAAVAFEDKVMVGPESAVLAREDRPVALISQGSSKPSDAAKRVIALLGAGEPDDVVPGLPAGGCKVAAEK